MLDALLVKDDEPVTIPIAGDIVPQASGHFVYTVNNATSNRRGFVVLQNSDQLVEPGSQCEWFINFMFTTYVQHCSKCKDFFIHRVFVI